MKEAGNPGVDRIELMQTFVRIVETGSLSAAAEQLKTSQPTVSRRLQTLERSLGLRLLQRTTHVMKLTGDGERCYAHAKELLENWKAMEADLRGTQDDPEGMLRVLVPHAFGQDQLIDLLTDYLARYPRVSVDWLLHDRRPDFIAEGIDCAIQVGDIDNPSLVALRLFEVPRIVVGSPDLLQGKLPAQPQELHALPWLALRTYYRDEVVLMRQPEGRRSARGGRGGRGANDAGNDKTNTHTHRFAIRPRMSTDSLYALRNAALKGLGVGLVSAWLVADDIAAGRLVQLVPEWRAAPLPVSLVYPYARFYPARTRLFIEAVRRIVLELETKTVAALSGKPSEKSAGRSSDKSAGKRKPAPK
ncbi:LysR family transcriptional regulator [Oxalicibacterium solurbis]|uniref:LysR family transcriptional regulator n=1 Tax=Oxalicibacterium solurbis TaxID=69280 RepID=A0A8J3AXH2_9BURK|nr:LysR family transcriptional regulator [Oxalicibacterium solurbis]GGI53951.1 LysR family transcriptional regulator [Oxalicibacterium solurbis]